MESKRQDDLFDFSNVIDDLPAAQFFWYDKVKNSPEKRTQYLSCLSKLISLFVAPHYFDIFPYKECSYLKKYEIFFSVPSRIDQLIEHLIRILSLHNPTIEVFVPIWGDKLKPSVLLETKTALDIGGKSLSSIIEPWFLYRPLKPMLIMYLSTNNFDLTSGHANLLALKKCGDHVKLLFIDPAGINETDNTFLIQLKKKIQKICNNTPIEQVITTCPELQTFEQGGNCVQWFAMMFALISLNPSTFDHLPGLIAQLERHPTLNILLFSLSIFLRTMPVFGLKSYYYSLFSYALHFRRDYSEVNQECSLSDIDLRQFLFTQFSSTDCTHYSSDNCPESCANCYSKCVSNDLLQESVQPCHVLTPKEMALKMFQAYSCIRDVTNMPDIEDMESHLRLINIQEATTLYDYKKMGLLPMKQIANILQKESELKRPREEHDLDEGLLQETRKIRRLQ